MKKIRGSTRFAYIKNNHTKYINVHNPSSYITFSQLRKSFSKFSHVSTAH